MAAIADAVPDKFQPPFLEGGLVTEILLRLPATEDTYRAAAVCPQWQAWRDLVLQPPFLSRHLSPPPPPLPHDEPATIILQPRRKVENGYVHLTLIPVEPINPADGPVHLHLNLPIAVKWTFPEIGGTEATDEPDLLRPVASVLGNPCAQLPVDAASPPPYVIFFEKTAPKLGISIVASHSSLLLGRSRTSYYVCYPAANRWLQLPPPSQPSNDETASPARGMLQSANCGFHYEVDAATGRLRFTVVALSKFKGRKVLASVFTSTTGTWATRVVPASGAARCLGGSTSYQGKDARSRCIASPGVFASDGFYWLSETRSRVLYYNVFDGHISVLRVPGKIDGASHRVEASMSIGYADGRLRLMAVDIVTMMNRVEGSLGVWDLDGGAPRQTGDGQTAAEWRSVHRGVWQGTWIDYSGTFESFLLIAYGKTLLRYDLTTRATTEIARLRPTFKPTRLDALYRSCSIFPFFK
ncbi:hypothetical protein CFC21_007073 [Triticum aestivum]|uniref:F-box domain-containing protein n=2 Tax=Triticum aestivum TaxID=4565 RepID=A0A3B5YXU9_WHEAT|nr:hypothetical protein CFC21_007073 [Triticum aestivum]